MKRLLGLMKALGIVWVLGLLVLFLPEYGWAKGKVLLRKAEVKKVAGGFSFTEGPAVDIDGSVYFVDQPNDRIYRWQEKQGVSLWLEGTGRANGMYFDHSGRLFACADENNQLVYFSREKKMHVVFEGFEGKHLNGPNDLWIAPNGGIYFTDPYYQRPWWPEGHSEVQDTRGVYYLSPEGEILRVINDFQMPNGIVGSPDGKNLYVADIKAGKTWKYTINPDGSLSNKTLFAPTGSDGMTIDNRGNVYLTSGVVWIYSPEGNLVQKIKFPEKPANVCLAGKKRNILFVTARTGVYTLKMKVKGVD